MNLVKNFLHIFALLPFSFWMAATLAGVPHKALSAELPPQEDPHAWTLITMPLVVHWESSPDHKYSFAIALERRNKVDDFLQGFSLFQNSFGQPSAYAYIGKQWHNIWDNPNVSFKLTGGVLYGYVDKWKDRVPFNHNGFSPGLIPVLVYHLDRAQTFDVMVLGVGGLGFSYSHNF